MSTLKERAEKEMGKGHAYVLSFAGWQITHIDVRALLVLARGLQETGHAWQIFSDGSHWSAWVPGMTKPVIDEF